MSLKKKKKNESYETPGGNEHVKSTTKLNCKCTSARSPWLHEL